MYSCPERLEEGLRSHRLGGAVTVSQPALVRPIFRPREKWDMLLTLNSIPRFSLITSLSHLPSHIRPLWTVFSNFIFILQLYCLVLCVLYYFLWFHGKLDKIMTFFTFYFQEEILLSGAILLSGLHPLQIFFLLGTTLMPIEI